MKTWYQTLFTLLRVLIHLPGLIVGWLFVIIFSWSAHNHRVEHPLILTAQLREWAGNKWRFSTTISRGMLMQKHRRRIDKAEALTRTEEHENIHVAQTEDLALLGLALGAVLWAVTGDWRFFVALWAASPVYQLPNFVMALLRHARPRPEGRSWFQHWIMQIMYRDSEHERSAYAQTEGHPRSWLSRRRDSEGI